MYGDGQIVGKWVCMIEDAGLAALTGSRVAGISELIAATVDAAMPAGAVA
jgi:hypothetical protein